MYVKICGVRTFVVTLVGSYYDASLYVCMYVSMYICEHVYMNVSMYVCYAVGSHYMFPCRCVCM
jgi:hypothetical protein